jgi:predicted ATPase/DNA-binding CsgD family transcriptional regulator
MTASSTTRQSRLPVPLTRLVGREREIPEACALLVEPHVRLLTLTGPGGVGKTRLAIAVAGAVAGKFADGISFVSLAALRDHTLVVPTVVAALELTEGSREPIDRLLEHFAERDALLVIDNFEQVLDAAPLVGTLLEGCPGLTITVTSRAPLRLAGEHEYLVQPMHVPDVDQLPKLDQLEQVEAVALFVQRAREARADFRLTDENAQPVAEICRQLDGLPLAIELAAARVKLLSPHDLAARLDRRLSLLTAGRHNVPDRQQTMRDTIAWSYALLAPDEQRLFRQLAIFAGGWTLETAEAVCDTDLDPLAGLAALVDHNLVHRGDDAGGATRYGMLETIREFGLEQLDASVERDLTRRRHQAFFVALAERSAREIHGPRQKAWLDQLEAEHNNLRAALQYALDHDPVSALRLAGALYRFWFSHGHLIEGVQWLRSALARSADHADGARATALAAAGGLLRELGEFDPAVRHLDEAISSYRALGDPAGLVFALFQLASVWMYQGESARARPLLENGLGLARQIGDRTGEALHLGTLAFMDADLPRCEQSLALRRELGEPRAIAMALGHLGNTALLAGDYARADAALREGLALARQIEDRWTIWFLLGIFGFVVLDQGDAVLARESFVEVLDLDRSLFGHHRSDVDSIEGLAGVALLSGLPDRAARLLGAAEALREQRNTRGLNPRARANEPTIDRMRERLRRAELRQAWSAGRALSPDEALALARAPLPAPAGGHAGGLSSRELEVLRLLADGKSNQEIAAALFISPNTVAHHVTSILNKLGLESRAAAAAYAVRHAFV